mmetsp:Transcript_1350/g.1543  ORF Transcript_1350/g.1543 Transcript_1350/m.1543 type:complete len:110 (-) Transcript_1350:74-403(-)
MTNNYNNKQLQQLTAHKSLGHYCNCHVSINGKHYFCQKRVDQVKTKMMCTHVFCIKNQFSIAVSIKYQFRKTVQSNKLKLETNKSTGYFRNGKECPNTARFGRHSGHAL